MFLMNKHNTNNLLFIDSSAAEDPGRRRRRRRGRRCSPTLNLLPHHLTSKHKLFIQSLVHLPQHVTEGGPTPRLYTAAAAFSSTRWAAVVAAGGVPRAGGCGCGVTLASRCSLVWKQLRMHIWQEEQGRLQQGRKRQMLTRHRNQPGDQQHQNRRAPPAVTPRTTYRTDRDTEARESEGDRKYRHGDRMNHTVNGSDGLKRQTDAKNSGHLVQ